MLRWINRCIGYWIFLCLVILMSSCGAKKKAVLHGSGTTKNSSPNHVKIKRSNIKEYYAEALGVNAKDLNVDLYKAIDEWMDVPHRLGGMNKSGVDCSGFVSIIYTDVYAKDLPRTSKDMADNIKRKYDNKLKEGDLVFFSFGGKEIDHVGIYLHNDKFVHVSTKKGVMISNLKDTWFYKYLKRCGTPKF